MITFLLIPALLALLFLAIVAGIVAGVNRGTAYANEPLMICIAAALVAAMQAAAIVGVNCR